VAGIYVQNANGEIHTVHFAAVLVTENIFYGDRYEKQNGLLEEKVRLSTPKMQLHF
jgi:hypothetical protein